MGISSNFMPIRPPVIPGKQPKSPDEQRQEQRQLDAFKARYGIVSKRAVERTPESPDARLQKIKAERYADIMGHEQAHKSAAGGFGGSIVINYDNNGVAVGGHVPITIPELDKSNPEGRLKDFSTIRSAALAPSDPSGQDMSVAAQAQALMGQAQLLIQQKQQAQKQKAPQ